MIHAQGHLLELAAAAEHLTAKPLGAGRLYSWTDHQMGVLLVGER